MGILGSKYTHVLFIVLVERLGGGSVDPGEDISYSKSRES